MTALSTFEAPHLPWASRGWIVRAILLLAVLILIAFGRNMTSSSAAQPGFYPRQVVSGVGGRPSASVETYVMGVQNTFTHPIRLVWISVPDHGTTRLVAWLREPHGVKIPLGQSRTDRIIVDKTIPASILIEIKGRIVAATAGKSKEQILRTLPNAKTVRYAYRFGGKTVVGASSLQR